MHWLHAHFGLFVLWARIWFWLFAAALAAIGCWPTARLLSVFGLINYLQLCGCGRGAAPGTREYRLLLLSGVMQALLPHTAAAHAAGATESYAKRGAAAAAAAFAHIVLEELLTAGSGK